jgi:hypothetical protein
MLRARLRLLFRDAVMAAAPGTCSLASSTCLLAASSCSAAISIQRAQNVCERPVNAQPHRAYASITRISYTAECCQCKVRTASALLNTVPCSKSCLPARRGSLQQRWFARLKVKLYNAPPTGSLPAANGEIAMRPHHLGGCTSVDLRAQSSLNRKEEDARLSKW